MEMIKRFYSGVMNGLLKIRNTQLAPALRIKSHLTIREIIKLYRLASGQKTILEIGSYIGASACCFGIAIKKAGLGKVFCVDTWNNDAMTEGRRDTYNEFLNNTSLFSQFIIPVRGLSTEVVEQIAVKTNHLDMLFIDGDHSYDGVKADWDAYRGFLKAGSIVVFHDWGWAEGVKRVIREEVSPVVSSFDSLPNMWWGTIKN